MTFVHRWRVVRIAGVLQIFIGFVLALWAFMPWQDTSQGFLVPGVVLGVMGALMWAMRMSIHVGDGQIVFRFMRKEEFRRAVSDITSLEELDDAGAWEVGGIGWRILEPGAYAYIVGGRRRVRLEFHDGDSVIVHAADVKTIADTINSAR